MSLPVQIFMGGNRGFYISIRAKIIDVITRNLLFGGELWTGSLLAVLSEVSVLSCSLKDF